MYTTRKKFCTANGRQRKAYAWEDGEFYTMPEILQQCDLSRSQVIRRIDADYPWWKPKYTKSSSKEFLVIGGPADGQKLQEIDIRAMAGDLPAYYVGLHSDVDSDGGHVFEYWAAIEHAERNGWIPFEAECASDTIMVTARGTHENECVTAYNKAGWR